MPLPKAHHGRFVAFACTLADPILP